MADRWYYSHNDQVIGPCSGQQLKEFAACGQILPTDTVWKEGIERGSLARKVRYLFQPGLVDTSPASTGNLLAKFAFQESTALPPSEAPAREAETVASILVPAVLARDTEPPPQQKITGPPNPSSYQPKRNKRAVAGKGVMIVGQDGINVKYRKKCTACGYEDSCWNSMPIPTGSTRVSLFCPKCKKRRDGEIQGYSN